MKLKLAISKSNLIDCVFFLDCVRYAQLEVSAQPQPTMPCIGIGGDATAMMMAAAKLATSATGPTKVDDVIDDINKKKQSIRSEADEQMNIGAAARKTEITAKQRWNWAFNKIVLQLNVSTFERSFIPEETKINRKWCFQ